jgi:hypothetical protein
VSSSSGSPAPTISEHQPLLNARFRVEIQGLTGTGATEVIFPEARIIRPRGKTPVVQYGTLTIRRGMTSSSDWYEWWDRARRSSKPTSREVRIIVMDTARADVTRWTYSSATPSGYLVSPLNALGGEVIVETLELTVGGLTIAFRLEH